MRNNMFIEYIQFSVKKSNPFYQSYDNIIKSIQKLLFD